MSQKISRVVSFIQDYLQPSCFFGGLALVVELSPIFRIISTGSQNRTNRKCNIYFQSRFFRCCQEFDSIIELLIQLTGSDKVVKLVSGGFLINGATLSSFCYLLYNWQILSSAGQAIAIQCSAVQCSKIQYNMQYIAVQLSRVNLFVMQ